ncbi:glycosyltransferase family 4 protein [Cyanobium sp. WAJ14-Wanaka]|uniref:glycosyltransferase family 4 protein n=1 Tax=Cyanobium sp. WAJ14-Wanaka TaxID=2823725 RepID=UPI0020CE6C26|nr:glycosyltransferase family 4 protein [Cyanobium sp. WAJ14-Wanaka]MCP9775639.1 glycosyltransferase family 4 protein [Cyanobium sp. WAJ14-Wanaka]
MDLLLITNLYPPQELGGFGRCMADFCWGLMQRGHRLQVISSDAPYLGPSSHGPSGEPVNRCLTLKGTFEGGMRFLGDRPKCLSIDHDNQKLIKHWLGLKEWDGILVGNLEMLGPELLLPLVSQGCSVLHHVGFITPPYPAELQPIHANYLPVAASRCVRKSLVASGFNHQPIPVVYPGARVGLFETSLTTNALPPKPLGTAASPLKVCFAGILMSTKGVQTLADAIVILHRQGIRVQANFAGKPYQKGLQQLLSANMAEGGLEENYFFGELSRTQLARFLRIHHVLVFPSIYPEAFGIVAAEAMASGLALVSSGVGGASELFEDGVSGLRFEPGNAPHLAQQLKRLLDEPGLLEKLQSVGKARVHERFSVTHSAQQLENLFMHYGKGDAASTKAPSLGSVIF